ncbi:molybdopterin cofactor-binding domain-containing protein [Limnohabitans sp. B9-3]|uniref:xanthine dehydrogenase family protein molybdopterin-binding subunit n=1 Tax=Limnohabitans sp. B9-3 TaxID=1100707 RepID=UPI000C1E9C7B|nr:molybdopterin cofactor-binding domain-containing protein [Limnohabitans sp. B9-3]PIT78630.1 aldehyde dehydrogenase [Limnohabitans sp. B9-3]
MQQHLSISRRGFLKTTGYLSLAFAIPLDNALSQADNTKPRLPGDLNNNRKLSAWLRINANQTVTLMVGKVELGQGILTAVTQVCADELDIDFSRVHLISGDTALVPNEGVTAGSFSMPNCATAVQYASAEVRSILLGLAAEKLNQPLAALSVRDGKITAQNGTHIAYWDLVLGAALERDATGLVKPKPAEQHRYIGQSVPRTDLPPKILGDAVFLQEHRPAGMVFGHLVRPPTYAAKLLSVNMDMAQTMPGVVKVVRNGSFLGVIAQREEQALAAAQVLSASAKWDVEKKLPTHEGIFEWLRNTKPNRIIETKVQPRAGGQAPAKTLAATYYRPYQMHASIGTSAAIATMGSDGVMLIQTHSQSVFETSLAIAKMLGLPPNKVRCQHMQGAGCYGHNMADDAAADAALLAMTVPGKPVRLQYTREQEHKWEPYGSAMVIQTKAGLDANGNVLDWDLQIWSTPHGTRPSGEPGNLLSARYLEKPFTQPVPVNGGPPNYAADRNGIALYDFAGHQVLTHFITDMPIRVSSTRGLGAYANVFAIESFMDELATAAHVDPLTYRLRFLKDERARDVLQKAADQFGWNSWKKTPNRGRGIGFARYKNIAGYCAVALEVEVNPRNGRIRVLRAVASADSGHIVNPDGVSNQIEGGLIQSLSWSLKEEVKFDDTQILSTDWNSYPILTFSEIPPVEVVLINRPGAPFLGTGEASQGPTSAALANAVFEATGVRFRQLPFTPERIKQGLDKKGTA